jgi:mRNA interferase MazF
MTSYKQRDIVLVDFGFSEETGVKKRPVLIISGEDYHHSRHEVIVMAVTSNIKRTLVGDTKIDEWAAAGLLYPSLVAGIIRTIKYTMVIRKLGSLAQGDFQKVQNNIKKAMDL